MKSLMAVFFLAISASAIAQTAEAIARQACGPKQAAFEVQLNEGKPPAVPEPGKALVYFIQKETGAPFTTRVGVDGAWIGVVQRNSYIFASVAPGEHHVCAATQNRKHFEAELVHFTAEVGKTYYYLVRGIAGGGDVGVFNSMEFGPADSDEARFLIASDPQSVATPKQ